MTHDLRTHLTHHKKLRKGFQDGASSKKLLTAVGYHTAAIVTRDSIPDTALIMPFRFIARQAYKTFPALNKVSEGTMVFAGTSISLAFCFATFYGGTTKKAGHGAFDVDKPESVRTSMDAAESIRLKNYVIPVPTEKVN